MSNETVKAVHSLNDVLQYEIPALFRRQHLNRDIIIGLIGDRGDGKTLGGSIIAICDYMVQNEPCFTNLDIGIRFNVGSEIAAKYGLQPGIAGWQSRELDLVKFLRFDPEYRGGVFFIDEINVALADARRSMSNQNIEATDVGQQLRKLQSALIYTSIHEMFVEWRIRDMTDVFIMTRDTALSPEGLAMKKSPGLEFEWAIYPMSRKLTGERYQDNKKTLEAKIRGRQWWGAVDTLQRQDRRKYNVPIGTMEDVDVEIGESPAVVAAKGRWGWLYDAIRKLHDDGYAQMHAEALWGYLQVEVRGLSRPQVGAQLRDMGIRKKAAPLSTGGGYVYLIDRFDLNRGVLEDTKEATLA